MLRSDMRASAVDGAFFSIMVGLGESYLSAFALALQIGEVATGLLVAIPMLIGATLQLASPRCVQVIGSHRLWVGWCAVAQALTLIVLPSAAVANEGTIVVLYVAASLYWAFGLAGGPAWNTWAEEIIPPELRARFFAWRSRLGQACVMLSFVSGGLLLAFAKPRQILLPTFAAIFIVAGLSRLASAASLFRTSEPSAGRAAIGHTSLREAMLNVRDHAGWKLLLFLFAVQVSVQLSGPYFSPFMLARLDLSYSQYMLLLALGFVGKVLALPAWGRLAQRAGVRTLMWIGAVGIVPLSGCWLALLWLERPMWYLAIVQVVGGCAWAAYELAFFLMFFETIPRHERTSVLTLYNFGNALAMVIGALLGAAWLATAGESFDSYLQLFGLSSLCRLASLALLLRVPQMDIKAVALALRTLSVSSSDDGSLDQPVLTTLEDQD